MAKSERDEALDALVSKQEMFREDHSHIVAQASRVLNAMLDDVLMDIALQAHQEVARTRALCEVCGIKCVNLSQPHESVPITIPLDAGNVCLPNTMPVYLLADST